MIRFKLSVLHDCFGNAQALSKGRLLPMDDMKDGFDRIFDDSARLVLMVYSGHYGTELQVYDRDISTSFPYVAFLLSDDNIIQFMTARLSGNPAILYLAGMTKADLESNRETGEPFPGIKIGRT